MTVSETDDNALNRQKLDHAASRIADALRTVTGTSGADTGALAALEARISALQLRLSVDPSSPGLASEIAMASAEASIAIEAALHIAGEGRAHVIHALLDQQQHAHQAFSRAADRFDDLYAQFEQNRIVPMSDENAEVIAEAQRQLVDAQASGDAQKIAEARFALIKARKQDVEDAASHGDPTALQMRDPLRSAFDDVKEAYTQFEDVMKDKERPAGFSLPSDHTLAQIVQTLRETPEAETLSARADDILASEEPSAFDAVALPPSNEKGRQL